ncbi:MAG: hypothetical protein LBH82_02710 [Bacteroidales bacterium]|jgi:hypothetical protein|nr:hypothetical protein [Bacteroidales bacterium]
MKNIINFQTIVATAVLIFFAGILQGFSQSQPAVNAIFEKYGSSKGVTLLEISEELMKDYQIKHFKSIIFDNGTAALSEIRKAIEKDKADAKRMKESVRDGLLTSGYYRLKTEETGMNRYLIFKIGKNNKTTLIYIEGKLSPEQLIELLK